MLLGKWFQTFGRTVVPLSSSSSSPSKIAMQEESVVWVADGQSGGWQINSVDVVGEAVVYRRKPQRGTLVGAVW